MQLYESLFIVAAAQGERDLRLSEMLQVREGIPVRRIRNQQASKKASKHGSDLRPSKIMWVCNASLSAPQGASKQASRYQVSGSQVSGNQAPGSKQASKQGNKQACLGVNTADPLHTLDVDG
eukprot:1158644-Pelagomonas_calceolata.AAC.2